MLRRPLALVLCLLMVPLAPFSVATASPAHEDAMPPGTTDESAIIEDGNIQLIVGHADGAGLALAPILAALGGHVVRNDPLLDFSVVQVPLGAEDTFRDDAMLRGGATYVQRDGRIEHMLVPDDPLYTQQWGAPAIGMEDAWDLARGSHNITVAVLDTGVDYNHPDLDGQVCGTGRDFINGDMDAMDDHGHGTHVSGTIAAHIDNGLGVAGMADVCIMPVKVLSAGGSGAWSGLASALVWTADQGVDIISMSLGGCAGCDPGSPMTEAIQYAAQQGVLIIAAAGNAYCAPVGYPAAYPEVVAVAALEAPGEDIAAFSSCGPEVEIAAPGHQIISTVPSFVDPSGYASWSGTSMATPHVSGVAALLMSTEAGLNADDVRCIIAQRADDLLAPGRDEETGFGRIDALGLLLNPQCLETLPVAPEVTAVAGDLKAHLTWNKPFAWGGVDGYDIFQAAGTGPLEHVASVGDVRTFAVEGLTAGETYSFAVAGTNSAGRGELSGPVPVVARAAVDVPTGIDFESGLGDWTATGLWHLTTDRAGSGTSAYFGRENGAGLEDNGFDTGVRHSGALTSPPLRMPATGPLSVAFWQHAGLGWSYEAHPRIQVANESDPNAFQDIWSMAGTVHEGTAAADLASLAGQVVWIRFFVDTMSPWGQDGEGWYVDDVTITASAPPALAPIGWFVAPEPGHIVAADHGLAIAVTDPNGQGDIASVAASVDGLPITGSFVIPEGYIARFYDLSNGTHSAGAVLTDDLGLTASLALEFEVDGYGPTTLISAPAPDGAFGCTVTVTGQTSDNYTGVSYIGVGIGVDPWSWAPVEPTWHVPVAEDSYDPPMSSVAWNFTIATRYVEPGPVRLVVLALDGAGNRVYENHTLVRDGTVCVPQVTISSPAVGAIVSCAVTVSGTAIAPEGHQLSMAIIDAGERSSWVELNGAVANFSVEVGTGLVPSGPFEIRIYVYDTAGGMGFTNRTAIRDATDCRPTVTIESPTDLEPVTCAVEVRGRATAAPGASLYVARLLVDGVPQETIALEGAAASFTFVADFVAAGEGNHTIQLMVMQDDYVDNVSVPIVVTREEADCYPTGAILLPTHGATAACTLTLAGNAQAGSPFGLGHVRFRIDGTQVGYAGIGRAGAGETSAGYWAGEARLGAFAAGTYVVDVMVFDGRNNGRSIGSVSFVRDATDCRPTISLDSPEDGTPVTCAARVAGTATDQDGRRIESVEVHLGQYFIDSWYYFDDVAMFETYIGRWMFEYADTLTIRARNDVGGVTEIQRTLVPQPIQDCRPLITVSSPSPGQNVSGLSDVEGSFTVIDVPPEADVSVWAGPMLLGTRRSTDGTFSIQVDWGALDDGPTTIAVTVDLDSGESGTTYFLVDVQNQGEPRLVGWSLDGTVVCSAKVAGLALRDACGGAYFQPVEAGLTGGRLILSWTTDDPAALGLDHLALRVTIGASTWSGTSLPGDGRLVLDLDVARPSRESVEARIDVTAGTDGSPLVLAILEDFHLEAQWAYGGAHPTI